MNITPLFRYSVTILLASATSVAFGSTSQITLSFTEPFESVDVSAAESGLIDVVAIREGQRVKTGDILGELDNRVLQESRRLAQHRAQSQARIDAARISLELKKSHYEKLIPLLESGHANESEVERAKADYDQALAAFRVAEEESAEAAIELARIEAQIAQRQIRSPVSGVVIDVYRRPGEFLSTQDPKFATIVQLDRLRVRFFVDTAAAQRLAAADSVRVRVHHSDVVKATVEFVSPVTDSQSGTVRVDVILNNADGQLRSGVPCELLLTDSPIEKRN